jgi:hypothetical protein
MRKQRAVLIAAIIIGLLALLVGVKEWVGRKKILLFDEPYPEVQEDVYLRRLGGFLR